jgi:hypothetical protein
VWENGVRDPISSPDLAAWPAAYREGVAEGLLVDDNGRVTVTATHIRDMVDILFPIRDHGASALRKIGDTVAKGTLSRMIKRAERDESLAKLDELLATGITKDVARALTSLRQRVEVLPG